MLENQSLIFRKCLVVLLFIIGTYSAQSQAPPNIILIITDDQGYGDLGFHGNPNVQTPVLDQFARESIRFNNFHVSPVCAPTRASLMTGRYSLRTGVRDTYNGGAIMHTDEVTIAEMLKTAGYQTGIFGKWHLGDNHPSRPKDQGFDESVVHLGGGMGQVGDFTTWFEGDSSYFDPVLWHNGDQESYQGYCSDIFTDQAVKFIEHHQDAPFFCYLSFNAPHTPLQVPERYYEIYEHLDPSKGFDDNLPFPEMNEKDKEDARKVYAMVTNIDDNVGRLLGKVDELNLKENTIVIFLTDNGPQQRRYVAGMRGRKSDVYQGGVRVPFFIRNPMIDKPVKEIETTAAHIDLLPTIAELCAAQIPADRVLDGKNLVPLMTGNIVEWENRALFFNWTRKYPELYNNVALQMGGYKLVGNTDYDAALSDFELFDLKEDPFELQNIITENESLAYELKSELDKTFNELIKSPHLLDPPRANLGTKHANPVILSRNDADGQRGIWAQQQIFGYWKVSILEGNYDVKFKFIKPIENPGRMVLETGTLVHQTRITETGTDIINMRNVHLTSMEGDLRPFFSTNSGDIFPFWVELTRLD